MRVREAGPAHVVNHASNTLAELLRDPEVRAHPGDARVACVSRDLERATRIAHSGKTARTGNLDTVGEDRHTDVVPGHRVRAVDDGVHHGLQPGVPGDDVRRAEGPLVLQSPALRGPLIDELSCSGDDVWDGALEASIAVGLHGLACPGACLVLSVA